MVVVRLIVAVEGYLWWLAVVRGVAVDGGTSMVVAGLMMAAIKWCGVCCSNGGGWGLF